MTKFEIFSLSVSTKFQSLCQMWASTKLLARTKFGKWTNHGFGKIDWYWLNFRILEATIKDFCKIWKGPKNVNFKVMVELTCIASACQRF